MSELGHAIEGLPREEIQSLQNKQFSQQMEYLWARSDHYRSVLADAGLSKDSVTDLRDIERIPFTTKEEIRQSLGRRKPLGEHIAADPLDVVQFHASTGTTGNPSYVGLTVRDRDNWAEITRRTLWAQGFRPGHRIVQAMGMSRGWVGGLPVVQGITALGASCIPAGAEPGTAWILNTICDLMPEGLIATPNFAMYMGEQAPKAVGKRAKDLSIQRIYVGGEPGGGIPHFRQQVQDLWEAEVREVMGGTDLAPVLWSECIEQDGMHFVAHEFVYWEIVDETGNVIPIESGATGELVYTHLQREATPVLRFRHADMIEILSTECSCGRTSPRIRCYGRTDDLLIIKGVNFYPSAVQDIVLEMKPATTGSVRIVKEQPEYAFPGPIKIRVERGVNSDPADDDSLRQSLEETILDMCRVRAVVEVVAPGTYPPPGRAKVRIIEEAYEE